MAYERKVDARDELLQRILLDAAKRVNDAAVPHEVIQN
jgi:hypothetical protein